MLSNECGRIKCSSIPSEEISDHETIKIEIKIKNKTNKNDGIEVFSWKNYNKQQLIENLRTQNWSTFNNINLTDKLKMLRENLNKSVESMIEIVSIRNGIQPKKWFDDEMRELKTDKLHKYNIWNGEKNDENWKRYTKTRNTYNKLIKIKKNESIQREIAKASTNQIKMWKCLRKLIPSENKNTSHEIIFENMPICDNELICTKFNKYFVDSIIQIRHEIPIKNGDIEIQNIQHEFKFEQTEIEKIVEIAKIMKKKNEQK